MRFITSLLVIGLTMSLGCSKSEGKENSDEKSEEKKVKVDERVPVDVAEVGTGPMAALIKASANLETESQISVLARASNPLVELLVEEGDVVKKGQTLARLENESQRLAFAKAKASFENNEAEFKRQENLFEQNLISQQIFNDAKFAFDQARLELEEAKLTLQYTEITAPIQGTITLRHVNLGDQISMNQALFDIVDFDTMVAKVFLPERHIGELKVGQEARIFSQAVKNQAFSGKVIRIAPTIDSRTGTVKVTVAVNAESILRPGMFVDVSLILHTVPDAVRLPKRAIIYEGDLMYVYRLMENKTVERLSIKPLLVEVDYVQPDGNINAGDKVVVAGHTGLKHGAKVRVLNAPDEPDQEKTSSEEASE